MPIYDQNVLEHLTIGPEIRSLAEAWMVHDAMIALRTTLFLQGKGNFYPHYRSEQCYGWNITPGLFRGPGAELSAQRGKELEREAIGEYEPVIVSKIGRQAFRELFHHNPNGKNWDLLFQAQHCGLHTSLVDWTMRLGASIFFGVEESRNGAIEGADGQLWAFMVHQSQLLTSDVNEEGENYLNHDPFHLERGFMTNVPIFLDDLEQRICERRMSRQGGRFYASANSQCNIPMNEQPDVAPYLFRFRIPSECKAAIREELNAVGVNHATTYVIESPAHDAVAGEVNNRIYGF